MSAELRIQADGLDDLVTAVTELDAGISGDDVRLVMGAAMREVIRNHFFEIASDAAHHKTAHALGASPTGVYEEAARGTAEPELESGGVSVSIHQVAIAQRFFGGPIEPVNAKFLAIPARTETYGRRPREFDNLRAIIFSSGAGALVQRDATVLRGGRRGGAKGAGTRSVAGVSSQRKGEEMGGGVFFWLVKQVVQEPDPTVLPDDDQIINEALARANAYVSRVWARQAA